MARYITADEAMHELAKVFMPNDFPKIVRAISSTRTADVRLDVHGMWIFKNDNIAIPTGYYECSICGEGKLMNKDNYCPNCGAEMGERRDNGEIH